MSNTKVLHVGESFVDLLWYFLILIDSPWSL